MAVKDIESLTIDDIKPITVSFKKTEDELILYKWILHHSNYSGFIKDSIRDIKENQNHKEDDKPLKTSNNKLLDMDF